MKIHVSVCTVFGCWVAGCTAPPTHVDLAAFQRAHEHTASATEIRLNAGDTIAFHSSRVYELDGETLRIRPDGKVSLDLLGEVKVAGLTASEVETKVESLLSPYYTTPRVRVQVAKQPNNVFYVLGQVGSPGPYEHTGRDSVLHVLAMAHPNHIAWRSRVKIIRPSPIDGERREMEVNLDTMVEGGDTRANILLEPGDVVYVPPTPLGWIGLRVRELLFPVGPVVQAYSTPLRFESVQEHYDNPELRRGQGTAEGE